nr:polysaccharide deacetylase family protein [uncultured Sphaerochaeta sp.]
MKQLLMALMIILFSFSLSAEVLPEQRSAPVSPERPPVRYWRPTESGNPLVQTLPGLEQPRPVPKRTDPKLLVVLYHNIVFGRTGNIYNRDLYNFEHDLAYLKRNYTITNFTELPALKSSTDAAIITFDDGDLSLYGIVYPLFRQYELEATIFLVPNFIGEVGYMSWEQVKEMSDYRTQEGKKLFHFESHSLTHRPMGSLGEEEIVQELKESKARIEEHTASEVTVLALPFGDGEGNTAIINAAKQLGYTTIRTSRPQATLLGKLNPWIVPALNVENYSTDVFVQKALSLTGRF